MLRPRFDYFSRANFSGSELLGISCPGRTAMALVKWTLDDDAGKLTVLFA